MASINTSGPSSLVFFVYKDRTVALLRPSTHEAAVGAAKATFSSLREIQPNCITLSAVLVGYPDRGCVEISPEAWPVASLGVDTLEIGIVEDGFDSSQRLPETALRSSKGIIPEAPAAAGPPKAADPGSSRAGMTLFIKTLSGKVMTFTDLHPSDTISSVKEKIENREGIPLNLQCLTFSGQRLKDSQTLSSYGIQDRTSIHFRVFLRG